MKTAKETWFIAAIGVMDLVTTILFIQRHGAEEANPLFQHYLKMGLLAFVTAKLICLACPLYVLEWARRRNPRLVGQAMRGVIVAYLVLYGVGFARLNGLEPPPAGAATVEGDTPPITAADAQFVEQMRERHRVARARYLALHGALLHGAAEACPAQDTRTMHSRAYQLRLRDGRPLD